MHARHFTMALTLAMAASPAAAVAQRLHTFAGTIDLPFAFHRLERIDRAGNSALEFSADQRQWLAIDSGAQAGAQAQVEVKYWVPAKGAADERLRELLRQPGVHQVQAVKLGAFPASRFVRRWRDADGEERAATVLVATINNALLTVQLEAPATGDPDALAAPAVSGFALDFDSALASRRRFDAAAAEASAGMRMRTATGDYAAGGMTPRLLDVWTQYAGDGRVLAERTAYSFARVGFWRGQVMSFASACGIADGAVAASRLAHFQPDSSFSRVVAQDPPAATRIGGLQASAYGFKMVSTHGSFGPALAGTRTIATAGAAWYAFDFISSDGAAFVTDLRAQVDARALACAPRALLTLDPPPTSAP